jgi:pimeloyl-ACP methyl ester carboxylesterase
LPFSQDFALVTSQRLDLSHGKTRFEVAGPPRGGPVLLVHGLTYPLEVWAGLVPLLVAEGFRVCRFDLYGRGESGFDGAPLTLAGLSEQALELIEAAGLGGPVSCVSLSNADLILAQLARLAPDRVRDVVCLAPSGWDSRTMGRLTRWSAWPWIMGGRIRARARDRMLGHRKRLPPDASPEIRAAYASAIASVDENPAFAAAVLNQIRHMPSYSEAAGLLRALSPSVPVSLVSFRAEQDATEKGLGLWLENVPWARRETLDGTHMGLLEHPALVAERVIRCLRAADA